MKRWFFFIAVILMLGAPQPALANMPPAPAQGMLAVVLIPLIMIMLSLVGGGYVVLNRLGKKESPSKVVIGIVGAILASLLFGFLGNFLAGLYFGINALQRGFKMISWGLRARVSRETPEHLKQANRWRLIPAGVLLIPVTLLLMGMPLASMNEPVVRYFLARIVPEFVAYQLAYAEFTETRTGDRRFHTIQRDDPEFCDFFRRACRGSQIDVEYGTDGKSFTVYVVPDHKFQFFPYNYLTSHPSFRADETGQIRMMYVRNRERCPPDAPVVMKVDESSVQYYKRKTKTFASLKQQYPNAAWTTIDEPSSIRDPRAVEGLTRILNDRDPDVRRKAADILRVMKDSRAVGPLVGRLKDENYEVRSSAAAALRSITGQDFGEDSVAWQEWWEQNKKLSARRNNT